MFFLWDPREEGIDGFQGCQELVLVTEGEGEVKSLTFPDGETSSGGLTNLHTNRMPGRAEKYLLL